MVLIELERVSKFYYLGDSKITALHKVDFSIEQGEFVALWGPSGSGKTTACNIIGLLDNPSEGAMTLKGKQVSGMSDACLSELRNDEIGIVFQNFNLIPVLSALENVKLPLQIRGVSSKLAQQKAEQQLSKVGLQDYLGHRPKKLSGGQQQRVAIARALVTDPSLIIADEPTANLDTATAHKIINLMMDINVQDGTTFLFSTHDQRLLERVKRQVLLQDGKIAENKLMAV